MKHLTYILLILFPLNFYGQKDNPFQAPLNEKFVNQTEKSGYVHPPLKLQHRKGITQKSAIILPSSFDLRDVDGVSYLPDVRNQNPYGTCWTFASLASIESSWKMDGDGSFINLSEANMAKCHGYDFDINDGGNEYLATAYLSRLAGPVYETADPYSSLLTSRTCPTLDKTTDIPAYIDDMLWLGDDEDLIKYTIMTYGAVATSMYSSFGSSYYNSSDYTYYYNGSTNSDHAVSIIGWDDDKVVTGGSSATPSRNGAWIIRNSWGSSWGNDGYFYASYDDVYIGKACELYHGKTPVSEIDTLFDYADLGMISAYNAGSQTGYAYAAVKYTAGADYFITHVGTAILTEGTTVSIALCQNHVDSTFTDTIAYIDDVVCNYAGYQKIEFPTLVPEGDFYLVMKYYTPDYNYPLPAEVVVDDYCTPTIESGKLWVSPDGISWTEGGYNTTFDFDLAVKIIAKHVEEIQPYFSVEKNTAALNQTILFTNYSMGEDIDSFVWCFPEDTFMTENTSETVTYSFSSIGQKQISIQAYKDGTAYTYTKENAVTIVNAIFPNIIVTGENDYYSKNATITLVGSGGDTYQWYADGYFDGDFGKVVSINPNDGVWVKMKATMGDCIGYDSVYLDIKIVAYDDIDEALELTVDETATGISNEYASVQDNEPMPPLTSCSSQNAWCSEGGLQNSIWFKFSAPTLGSVSISTYGFDNQIALYDAVETGTCDDIISGNSEYYTILAANDDYHTADYSAVITEVTGLTANKTYWIQMDGSAGGTTGKTSIVVESTGTFIDNVAYALNVINTANKFCIEGENIENSQLSIINTLGQVIYNGQTGYEDFSLSGNQFSSGFYLININNENINKTYKVIISDDWLLSIKPQ